jgi:transposase
LFARTKPDSYNAASLIQLLKQLRRFARQHEVILIWDHLPAHRSRLMKEFLRDQQDWLQIEWLPGYPPDLNPTEGVWNNIKAREMANLCPRRTRRSGHIVPPRSSALESHGSPSIFLPASRRPFF